MKIRTGFVSNSSSSSFCIIGTTNEDIILQLMKKDGFPFIKGKETVSHYDRAGRAKNKIQYKKELENAKDVEVLDLNKINGSYGYWDIKNKSIGLIYLGGSNAPDYAGLNAEPILLHKSIQQGKDYLKEYIKEKYEIDIDTNDLEFIYGEVSS